MPELPDVEVYVEHLNARLQGETLQGVRLATPFLLRTFDPPIKEAAGKRVDGFRRLGKRIVFDLEGDLHLVLHLMISGRLHWKDELQAKPTAKVGLAAFDFPKGTLTLTEASPKKRASLYFVHGEAAVEAHDPGGLEVFTIDAETFTQALRRENHTLKRTLTDPRVFSGIGNAYSDEILHRARLSPVRLTKQLDDDEARRLFEATRETLGEWLERLRAGYKDAFPEKVTAFRPEMAVHGKYGKPCPRCGTKVQRIRYADNEANYCPECQTGGKLLADRGLSRLLGKDWPKSLDELEAMKADRKA